MNAKEIKVGKRYTTKIGKNEVVVTFIGETEKGRMVKTSTGKIFPIKNPERFIKCLDVETAITQKSADSSKPEVSQEGKKMSMLNAAIEVLKTSSQPMSAKELIAEMEAANLWKSPKGATPCNTLAAAINREISGKENPRFKKAEKGKFALTDGTHANTVPCTNITP